MKPALKISFVACSFFRIIQVQQEPAALGRR